MGIPGRAVLRAGLMYESKPMTELRPACRLCVDEMPPTGEQVWLITKYGNGFRGLYHPEYAIVAWAPVPKLTDEQKARLREMGYEF